MDKYIFFDIDGVLNKTSQWRTMYSLDKDLVANFCNLVKKDGLMPIMTSSWRGGFVKSGSKDNIPQIKTLEEMFSAYGVRIAGKTPIFKGKSRDLEIERYLFYHPSSKYVILDDDRSEYESIDEHNYFVSSERGLEKGDVKQIQKLLKRL